MGCVLKIEKDSASEFSGFELLEPHIPLDTFTSEKPVDTASPIPLRMELSDKWA